MIVGKKASVHGELTIEVCGQSGHCLSLNCRGQDYKSVAHPETVVENDKHITENAEQWVQAVSHWAARSTSTWMANEPEGNAENLKTDSLKELHVAAWFGVESSRFIDEGAHYISQELFTTQNIVMLASPVIDEQVCFQHVVMQLFMDWKPHNGLYPLTFSWPGERQSVRTKTMISWLSRCRNDLASRRSRKSCNINSRGKKKFLVVKGGTKPW